MLRDRESNARHVGFLKRIRTNELAANLPSNAHDWRRIEHRGRDTRHHISGPGTGRGHRDTNLPTGTCIAISHVRRTLFMANQHVTDRIFEHGVVCRKDGSPGVTEHRTHSLAHERFPNDLRARPYIRHRRNLTIRQKSTETPGMNSSISTVRETTNETKYIQAYLAITSEIKTVLSSAGLPHHSLPPSI